MRLLREYIREVLSEAAAGIADMKNKKVYYTASDKGIQVWLASSRAVDFAVRQGEVATAGIVSTLNRIADGTVEAKSGMSSTYNCSGAYTITFSEVDQGRAPGFGPMLYDVVMELATEWDAGLTPDRVNVSDDAFNVWDYYHKNRDVVVRQLDDTEGRLTPDDGSDDCEQEAAYGGGDGRYGWWDESDEDTPWDPDGQEVLLNSPLSKVYMSKGSPMVKALEAADKLVDIYTLEEGF